MDQTIRLNPFGKGTLAITQVNGASLRLVTERKTVTHGDVGVLIVDGDDVVMVDIDLASVRAVVAFLQKHLERADRCLQN